MATKAKTKLEYEVVPGRDAPGEWRVEAIDYDNEGQVYVAIFSGPGAQERAEEVLPFAVESGDLVRFLGERFDHPHAAQEFLQRSRQTAVRLLHCPEQGPDRASVAHGAPEQGRDRQHRQERKLPGQMPGHHRDDHVGAQ